MVKNPKAFDLIMVKMTIQQKFSLGDKMTCYLQDVVESLKFLEEHITSCLPLLTDQPIDPHDSETLVYARSDLPDHDPA